MNNLTIIEHKGIRVLTTQQLAEVYETDAKNIHMNYSNNMDRFLAGRDYFYLDGDSLKEFKSSLPNNIGEPLKFAPSLILWTERGANRHSKILDTDKAWQQFDVLEETYFKAKNNVPQMTQVQIVAALAQAAAEAEQKMLAIEAKVDTAARGLQLVKDTFAKRDDDNWRKNINADFVKIVEHGGIDYRAAKSESYQILEDRARCRLAIRVKNAKGRLRETGATKTVINNFCNLDAIEQDPQLKEIYTTIVKEMMIRYVA